MISTEQPIQTEQNVTSKTQRSSDLMVVDDNPKNLKLLERMLYDCGFRVRLFPRGKMALASAAANPPELFLLDINMPEMDGYEVCRQLKSDPHLAAIPVIFLSALNDTGDKIKAFEVGGVDYITKPFQLEEVRARIETHLALRRSTFLLQQSFDKLKELERLRDSLVHMIVHDMRTPLTIISGSLELLLQTEGKQMSEKALSRIDKAKLGTNKLIEMVNSLLDISKLESGTETIHPKPVDIIELVQEVVGAFSDSPTGHKVHAEVLTGPVIASCDRGMVSRVIQNLIGNATKYSPNGTDVTLRLEQRSESIRITVRDQGPGIPVEHRNRVFDKFYQVGHKKNSSGLGLTFCRLVVEAHGGTIGVDSEPDNGSEFWFTLPLSISN